MQKTRRIGFTGHEGNEFGCYQNQFIFKDNDALQDVTHGECGNLGTRVLEEHFR